MAKSKVKPGTPHPTRKGLVMGKNGRYVAKTTYAKQLKAAAQAEKGGAIVKSKGSAIVKSKGGAIVKDKGSAIVKDKGSAIVKNKGGAITKQGSSAVVKTKPGVAALRRQAVAAAGKATSASGLRAALGMIIKRAGPVGTALTISSLFTDPAVQKAYQNYDPKSLVKRGAGGGQGNKGRNKPEPPKPRQMSNIPPKEGTGGEAEKKLKYGAHAEKPAEPQKLRDKTPEQREKNKSAMRAAYEKAKAAGNYKEADRLGREIYNRTYKKTKFKSGTQGVSRRTDKEKAEYDKKKKLKAAQRSTGQRQVNRGYA